MDKESIFKQVKDFKDKYGKFPKFPVRVNYTWMTTKAQGDIQETRFNNLAIFGYPGMVSPWDEEVKDLVMLHDGNQRPFPNAREESGQRIISILPRRLDWRLFELKVIKRIEVQVSEPFTGGSLTVKAKGITIIPAIYLAGVREPSYEGVSPEVVAWDKAHRQKGGYIWLSDELYYPPIDGEPEWEIIGEPKENVTVKIHTVEI